MATKSEHTNGAANDVYTRDSETQKVINVALQAWIRGAFSKDMFFDLVQVLRVTEPSDVLALPRAAVTPKADLVTTKQ